MYCIVKNLAQNLIWCTWFGGFDVIQLITHVYWLILAARRLRDWDKQLVFVLFTYRASLQESTGESPFLLLYGRTPGVPTDAVWREVY